MTSAPPDGWDGWRNGHSFRAMGRLSSGDRPGFEQDLEACARFGAERKFWYFRWLAQMWRAGLALLDGRFDDVAELAARAVELAPADFMRAEFATRQRYRLHVERGDAAGEVTAATELVDRWPGNRMHEAMLALAEAELHGVDSDRGRFERLVDGGLGPMWPERKPVTLAYWTELAILLGGPERAAALYATFEPYRNQVVIGGMADGCMGAVDRYLGMLAAQQGRWDEAELHYDTALGLGLRSPPLVARTRYWYGRTLLARGGEGDHRRAAQQLSAAAQTAEALGMAALAAAIYSETTGRP